VVHPRPCAGLRRSVNARVSALCPEAWSPGPALGVRPKSVWLSMCRANTICSRPEMCCAAYGCDQGVVHGTDDNDVECAGSGHVLRR